MNDIDIESLKGVAKQLRIHSIEATTAAGSGHPTSCCSAADLVAALFFGHMRYDPKNPHYHNNDRFILSKGHAAPLLYAAWAETGLFPGGGTAQAPPVRQRPGRPSDAAPAVRGRGDRVAGPGLERRRRHGAVRAIGQAGLPDLCPARRRRMRGRLGVGSGFAGGRYAPEQPGRACGCEPARPEPAHGAGHDLDGYKRRFEAFGWRTEEIDGHDLEEITRSAGRRGPGSQPLVDPGQDDERRRRLVPARQGRVARQTALPRRSRPRDRRTAAHCQDPASACPIAAPNPLPAPNNAAPASLPAHHL